MFASLSSSTTIAFTAVLMPSSLPRRSYRVVVGVELVAVVVVVGTVPASAFIGASSLQPATSAPAETSDPRAIARIPFFMRMRVPPKKQSQPVSAEHYARRASSDPACFGVAVNAWAARRHAQLCSKHAEAS